MAKVNSIIKIEGTVEDLTFYKKDMDKINEWLQHNRLIINLKKKQSNVHLSLRQRNRKTLSIFKIS